MSMHIDPACRVPDNSFFNFPSLDPSFRWVSKDQYMHDVTLQCSSLFTEENVSRLEEACLVLGNTFGAGATNRLDEAVAKFQEMVGPELLEELRTGLAYLLLCSGDDDAGLPVIFSRDLDKALLRNVAKTWSYSWHLTFRRAIPQGLDTMKMGKPLNLSHYASYLSNYAAWLCRRDSALDPGTMHVLSLMLARGNAGDHAEDKRRIAEALAVASAEYVRRPDFLREVGERDSATSPYSMTRLARAEWDPKIVSLKAPVERLSRSGNNLYLADLVELAVDNRLVKMDDPGEDVSRTVMRPKLFGWDDDLDHSVAESFELKGSKMVHQERTKLLPFMAMEVKLGRRGIPALFGRSGSGYPALLFPADDRTMKFLARLYGVEIPTILDPLEAEHALVWSYVYDPRRLADVLRSERAPFRYYGARGEFVRSGESRRDRCVYSGTAELSEYLDGVDSTDMFVNELMFV